MYHFGWHPSNSVALLVAVGRAAHLVGPHRCVLVFLGLVISGAAGVLLVGRATLCPSVAAALLCLGGVKRHFQG